MLSAKSLEIYNYKNKLLYCTSQLSLTFNLRLVTSCVCIPQQTAMPNAFFFYFIHPYFQFLLLNEKKVYIDFFFENMKTNGSEIPRFTKKNSTTIERTM